MSSIESFCTNLPHANVLSRFLVAMSRFEYALKEADFWFVNNNDVHPDWKAYAATIADLNADEDEELRKAIEYLKNNPPKKQVVNDGGLRFASTNLGPEKNSVLMAIKTVRNNAVHGGKFPFDENRDKQLLDVALIILEAAIGHNDEVHDAFFAHDVHLTL